MKSTVREEDYTNRINRQVDMAKVSLQVGGHWLWFDLERDWTHQVELPKIDHA